MTGPQESRGERPLFPQHWGDKCIPEERNGKDSSLSPPLQHGDSPRLLGRPAHTERRYNLEGSEAFPQMRISVLLIQPCQQEGGLC